ncbi:MAG: S-layer homology domain-containing protein [Oscillospiraceae bacterium]|nr:S-layer homology domain-containing protein [Oscillospiraceae bacterium]
MKKNTLLALLLSLTLLLGSAPVLAADGFTDVPEDAYYAEAVAWALETGVTNGRGNNRFAPDATVTRAEAVTFLWRMAGKPAPTQTETFADVAAAANSGWYKTAVQWAVEQGITNGTGGGRFSPQLTCNRGMILTMLYRMEGCPYDELMKEALPENEEDLDFAQLGAFMVQKYVETLRSGEVITDVKADAYYELPVVWALLNGVLGEAQLDAEAKLLHPERACPRGEMVYYLHKTDAYETAMAEIAEFNQPVEPVAVGTVPETVLLDENGVKITLTGIDNTQSAQDVWLNLTVENNSKHKLLIEAGDLYVNDVFVNASAFVPVEEDGWTGYDNAEVAAGARLDFNVAMDALADKGIDTVYAFELSLTATDLVSGDDYTVVAACDLVPVKTSLYEEGVSYDPEGTVVCEKDGLRVLVIRAENNAFIGPQLTLFAGNDGTAEVSLELTALKLDGEAVEASAGLHVMPGRRSAETVYIEIDYDNVPTAREAELTLSLLDPKTWEPTLTFDPVTIPLTE